MLIQPDRLKKCVALICLPFGLLAKWNIWNILCSFSFIIIFLFPCNYIFESLSEVPLVGRWATMNVTIKKKISLSFSYPNSYSICQLLPLRRTVDEINALFCVVLHQGIGEEAQSAFKQVYHIPQHVALSKSQQSKRHHL